MARLRDLERFFRKTGIELVRQERGSHRIYHRPDCHEFVVSVHPSREIYRALLAKILKDAGYTLQDFYQDP